MLSDTLIMIRLCLPKAMEQPSGTETCDTVNPKQTLPSSPCFSGVFSTTTQSLACGLTHICTAQGIITAVFADCRLTFTIIPLLFRLTEGEAKPSGHTTSNKRHVAPQILAKLKLVLGTHVPVKRRPVHIFLFASTLFEPCVADTSK